MEQADWDLQAVVRGCCTTTTTNTTATNSSTTTASAANAAASTTKEAALVEDFKPYMGPFSSFGGVMKSSNIKQEGGSSLLSFPSSNNPFEARNANDEELYELYKPFVSSKSEAIISPHSGVIPKVSPFRVSRESLAVVPQKVKQLSLSASAASSSRSKRRKNQLKKVCHVSAEGVSSDIWSWRKYGQKPIKGSPYPRGYYKCSSCKGCLARKQVERNRSDPTMFIVTYTGEHSHPIPTHKNSLAGTTRQQKPQSPRQDEPDKPLNKPCTSSSLATMSTASADDEICTKAQGNVVDGEISDLMLEDEEETDEDMGVTDDFFEGLDEIIAGSASGDGTSPPFSGSFHLPFITNNTTAAAGGS